MPFVASHHRGIAPQSGIITNGIVGRWPLDEGSGDTTACSHGPGPDGTIIGSPAWVTGYYGVGYALDFDQAVDQEVQLGNDPSLDIPNDFSIMCRAKGVNANGIRGLIAIASASFSKNYALLMWDGRIGMMSGIHAGGQPLRYTTARYDDGFWHHFVAVMEGMDRRLYIDGVEDTDIQNASYTFNMDVNALVGKVFSGDLRFAGTTDDFRIYERALLDTEIMDIAAGLG